MFKTGEYIIYGSTGACLVADVTTLDMEGAVKGRLYYVLEPVGVGGSRIFTPVDNNKNCMRRVMNRSEAEELMDSIPDIEPFCFQNDKQHEEAFKEALKSCDCRMWVKVLKTVYQFKKVRGLKGKKLNSVDEKYWKKAQDNLYSELAIPMLVPKERLEEYISEKLEGQAVPECGF